MMQLWCPAEKGASEGWAGMVRTQAGAGDFSQMEAGAAAGAMVGRRGRAIGRRAAGQILVEALVGPVGAPRAELAGRGSEEEAEAVAVFRLEEAGAEAEELAAGMRLP
jgi:hypothetical protein